MISASHNPYEDNGIKLFGPDGLKLSDEQEREIEALMGGDLPRPWWVRASSAGRRAWRTRRGATSRRRSSPFRAG
jgi:phosphoglucosamine mutase